MYIYAPLKRKLYPTIQQATRAMQQADNSDPQYRDQRPLMAILMRIAEASPRIRGHVLTRRTAVTSFTWSIISPDPALAEDAKRAELRLKPLIDRLLNWHTDTPGFGARVVRIGWATGKPYGTTPYLIKRYQPVEIDRPSSDPAEVSVLADTTNIQRQLIANEDPHSWLVDVDESYVVGGLHRTVIYHELLRNDTMQEWGTFNTKLKGIILAKHKPYASEPDKLTAIETLKNIAKNNAGLSSDAINYEFVNMVNQIGAAAFSDFKKMLEDDVAIVWRGQANTTQLPNGGGSRAALQVMQLLTADIHFADINREQLFQNNGLLLHDYQLNYEPNATAVPWEFRINVFEDEDTEKAARTLVELQQIGIPVLAAELYESIGYTRPAPGDDVIELKIPSSMPPFGSTA
ncbi:MAG: DUF935 family protein [Bacteroidota bacterium]